jgi:hypothetical protein
MIDAAYADLPLIQGCRLGKASTGKASPLVRLWSVMKGGAYLTARI